MSKTDEEIERLIKDYSRTIAIIINGYNSHNDGIYVEDLAQEVYIRIWKTFKSDGHDIESFYSYVRKIINSVFINEIKKKIKDKKTLASISPEVPLFIVSENEKTDPNDKLHNIIAETLPKIKKPERRALKQRLAGMSLNDIARLNRWSEAKTRNIYYRGLNNMKQLVRKKGYEYED